MSKPFTNIMKIAAVCIALVAIVAAFVFTGNDQKTTSTTKSNTPTQNKKQAATTSNNKSNDQAASNSDQPVAVSGNSQAGDSNNNVVSSTGSYVFQKTNNPTAIVASASNVQNTGSDSNDNSSTDNSGSTSSTGSTGSTGDTGSTGTGSTGTGSTGTGSTGTGSTGTGSTGTGSTGTGSTGTGSTTGGSFTPTSANLVANPTVATASTGYGNYADPAAQFSFTFQATDGHSGANDGFLRTTMTGANTNRYGATTYGSWSPNPITTTNTAPQMYAYSMWYRSDVDTEVDAAIQLSDGTYAYPVLGRPLATNGEWKQFSASFVVPAGAKNVTASAIILTHGTLDTDDFYLGTFTPKALTGGAMLSLTFDDGWKSIHDNGRPILNDTAHNGAAPLKSTQFIISGALNTDGYMTDQDVKDFQADGAEIGNHTVNHIPLTDKTSLSAAQSSVANEINGNETALQALLGVKPTDMATPEGEYDSETIAALKAAGVNTQRSVEEGYNSPDAGIFNPYDIKVQNITRATTLADVQGWIAEAQATNTWLVIVYHEVTDTPAEGATGATNTQYWTPVADFQAQMDAVRASGIRTVTMNEGLSAINAQL